MKLLALLALVVVATASHRRPTSGEWLERVHRERGITKTKYMAGDQYEYLYDGQLMSGIPQSSEQHSATRVQAYVVLQFLDAHTINLKLNHIRFGSYNDYVLSPREMQPFEIFEEIDIQEEHLTTLMKPCKFHYKNGMISDVHFDGAEETWSANIKRSVMNMLQVNLKKERLINPELERFTEDKDSEEMSEGVKKFDMFTVMEKSIEGECETDYTVVSMPPRRGRDIDEDILNVTRSINFENCRRRPDIRYNFRFQTICPTCDHRFNKQERVLRSSTVIRQNLTAVRDRATNMIESTIVESQYTLVPFTDEGNLIQTYVNQTLLLLRTRPIVPTPQPASAIKSDTGLMASVDWDVEKEKFFQHGEQKFLANSPYSDINDKVSFIKSILLDMLKGMRDDVTPEAPRQFTRLVKVFRLLNKEELKRVHQQFVENGANLTPEEHKKVRALGIDAVALCGTKDCIDHLVEMIKNPQQSRVTTVKATMLLRKLTGTRTVSKAMINKVWTIPSEERCTRSPMLCQSAYLAVGSMLHAICAPNKDRLAKEYKYANTPNKYIECNREEKKDWVQRLYATFEQCTSDLCRVTMLKTLANAGIDESIYKLEKIIKDRKYSPSIRVEAVLATRLLAPQMPRKVQKVLMPLYTNKMELPFVRMAAFSKIMQTQPSKAIIDQLTLSLYTENNPQVATFVFTSFQSFANSTNPCEQRVADDIKLSLRHARTLPVYSWLRSSKFVRAQAYWQRINRGVQLDLNSIMTNYSFMPKDFAASLHMETANIWSRYVATVGFTQSNLDEYLRRVMRRSGHHLQTAILDVLSGESSSEESSAESSESDEYSPKFNYRNKLNKMFEQMDIDSRESNYPTSDKQLLANMYLRFFDQDYLFFPLTKEILPEYIKEYLGKTGEDISMETMVEKVEKYLNDVSLPFNVRSATLGMEGSRKIFTSFGMPLQLSIKMPTVAQASGIVKIKFNKVDKFTKMEVELKQFKPSFALTIVEKLEMWSPILNTGVKLVVAAKVHAPFDGRLSLDMTKQQPELKFTWQPKKQGYELVSLETKPMTTVLVWPSQLRQWKEPTEKVIKGEEWTRVATWDEKVGREALGVEFHAHGKWHYTHIDKVSTTPMCVLAGPNRLAVHVRPGTEMPREFNVILSGKLFQYFPKMKLSPDFDKFYTKSDEDLELSSSSSSESREDRPDSSSSESKESIERHNLHKKYVEDYKETSVTKNMLKLRFIGKGSSIKREMTVSGMWQCGKFDKTCLAKINIERTPITTVESTPWTFNSKIETLFPKTPYSIDELTEGGDKKFVCRINSKWGYKDQTNKHFTDIKIVGEQSDDLQEIVRNTAYYMSYKDEETRNRHRSHFSPVGQYEQTLKYAILDQYKMDIDYRMHPYIKNTTEQFFRAINYYYYWNSQIDFQLPREQQEKNQIVARINIDPLNRRYVNISVTTPTQRTRLYDLPIAASLVEPLNVRRSSSPARSIYGLVSEYIVGERNDDYLPICHIRTDRVKTFDGLSYRAPVSTCYSLVTKDCYSSAEGKFAVYIKRQSPETEKKMLKIVSQEVKVLVRVTDDDKLECKVNNEQYKRCEEVDEVLGDRRHTLLRIDSYDGTYIKMYLGESAMRIYFDGYAMNVKASTYQNGELCGLCGHFDSQIDECELRTSENECIDRERASEVKRFYESFLVRKECDFEEKYNKVSHYERDEYDWEDEIDPRWFGLKCKACKIVVPMVKKQVDKCAGSPACEGKIASVLDGMCSDIPFVGSVCKKIVRENLPKLLHAISSGANANRVCKAVKLC